MTACEGITEKQQQAEREYDTLSFLVLSIRTRTEMQLNGLSRDINVALYMLVAVLI